MWLPVKEPPIGCPAINKSTPKAYIQVILYGLNRLYLEIYVTIYLCIHIYTNAYMYATTAD